MKKQSLYILMGILLIGIVIAGTTGLPNSNEILNDMGIQGMRIENFKVDSATINKLEEDNSNIKFETELVKIPAGLKQNIWITNKKPVKDFSYSQLVEIDYNEIMWNGTIYKLKSSPITLGSWYKDGRLIAPNIFMGKEYKRINYRDIAEKGGYALAYQSGGKNYIELRIDKINIREGERYYIDPVFTNATDGLSLVDVSSGATYWTIWRNATDIYLTSQFGLSRFMHHLNSAGINQSDGFDLITTGCTTSRGLIGNNSDFWLVDDTDDWMYHLNGAGVNQTDGFLLNYKGGNINPESMAGNGTDFWIADNDGGLGNPFLFHLNSAGVNQTDGFNLADIGMAEVIVSSQDQEDGSFWLEEGVGLVFHANSAGVNQTDGFDLYGLTGANDVPSFIHYNHDIWAVDNTDKFIYHLIGNFTTSFNVTLNSPANNSIYLKGESILFNATLNARNIDNVNATLFVWNSTNSVVNRTINLVTGQVANETIFDITNLGSNTYLWNVFGCAVNSTDTLCGWDINRTITIVSFTENATTYNATVYETDSESFILNITTNGTTPTARFFFNNIFKTISTITSLAGNSFLLSNIIDIPLLTGVMDFYWEVTIGGGISNSTISNTTIYATNLTECKASNPEEYLNFTFQDEGNLTYLTGKVTSSIFNYWLGSGSAIKTFSYTNTTGLANFSLCFSPQNRTANINYTISYEATGYQQRTSKLTGSIQLTNSTTIQPLYLLSSVDGIYVTFQVINAAEQVLSNVYVTINITIGGTSTEISSGYTDAAGTITLWLDPDVAHTFVFTLTGYDPYTTSITPTQSSYTITLGGLPAVTANDYTRGISYIIEPLAKTLFNETTYQFNFTLTSTYWDVEQFGFYLTNSSDDLLNSTSLNANGGTTTVYHNTGNYSNIIMNYYWVIDSNYTNATTIWRVSNSAGTDWSIRNFFEDLSSYMTAGMFGLDNFGIAVLAFLVILLSGGILSYKFGITSPAAITAFIFALVVFLDVSTDLLDNLNPTPIPNFPSFIVGAIVIGLIIREGLK